jgi:hypothetical protein
MKIVDILLQILGWLTILPFLTFFVLVISYRLNFSNKEFYKELFKNKIAKYSGILTVVFFALSFAGNHLFIEFARKEVEIFLKKKNISIMMNNRNVKTELVKDFKNIKSKPLERPYSNKEFELKFKSGNDELILFAKQSTIDSSKYWIYNIKYSSIDNDNLGQITTNLLNEYKSQ